MISGYIILTMEQIPKGTAQMKRYNGRARTYFKSQRLQQTEDFYLDELLSYAPTAPITGAVSLSIDFDYFTPTKKRRGKWKTTRPDCDNLVKILIDCMTRCGFWVDDSQVVIFRLAKRYTIQDEASIHIYYREVFDDE